MQLCDIDGGIYFLLFWAVLVGVCLIPGRIGEEAKTLMFGGKRDDDDQAW